jgi:hypothetical protein
MAAIMACGEPVAEAAPASTAPKAALKRAGVDPQLSRILDAWPGLAKPLRGKMVALLDAAVRPIPSSRVSEVETVAAKRPRAPAPKSQSSPPPDASRRRRARKIDA